MEPKEEKTFSLHSNPWSRIAAYLADELSVAERDETERWLSEKPDRLEALRRMRSEWNARGPQPQVNLEKAWPRIAEDTVASSNGKQMFRRPFMRVGTGMFVSTLLIGAIFLSNTFHNQTSAIQSPPAVYITPKGQRAEVRLPDGSRILLNVASRLEISPDFGEKNRTVNLSGEAHFEVEHEGSLPFIVETGTTRTLVLGTKFIVHAYSQDTVMVAVESGRVSVGQSVLNANDVVHLINSRVASIKHNQSLDSELSFLKGNLILDDILIGDAIEQLNRWYNADIRLTTETLAQERISVVAAAGSINDLTALLRLILNLPVERTGRIITIGKE